MMDSETWECFCVCRQFCWTALGFFVVEFSLFIVYFLMLSHTQGSVSLPLLWEHLAIWWAGGHTSLAPVGDTDVSPRFCLLCSQSPWNSEMFSSVVMRDLARLPREVILSEQALVGGKQPRGCGGLCKLVPKLWACRLTALNSGGIWFYLCCFRLLANCLALLLILIWEVTGPLKIV